MKTIPIVTVVLLNYQEFSDTIDFVKKIKQQKGINLQILIVDNHSPNNSFNILLDTFKKDVTIDVIQTISNKGYATGNNFGFLYLKERKTEFILISNNDVIIDDDFLISKMTESYLECDSPAFLNPMIRNENNERARFSAWKIPTFFDDLKSLLFLDRIHFLKSDKKYNFPQAIIPVDCVPGSFSLIKKDVLFDLGLFDENTFLYCEERINAKKVKEKGLQNYLNTKLSYIHQEGGTINKYFSYIGKMKILVTSRIYFHVRYNNIFKFLAYTLWFALGLNFIIYFIYKLLKDDK
jgi:GT2 family glycosyltransferase